MQRNCSETMFTIRRFAILPLGGLFVVIVTLFMGQSQAQAQSVSGQPAFSLQAQTYNTAVPATRYHLVLEAKPGSTIEERVQVMNVGTATGSVDIYPVSATTAQSGSVSYLAKGASPRDMADWIVMSEQQLTLAPGQSQTFAFQIVVPAGASAGQHFGGIAAANLAPISSAQNGQLHINVMMRHVMSIQLSLPGQLIEHMAVTGAKVGGSNGYQQVLLSTANTGNTKLSPTGELKINDQQGKTLQDIPFTIGAFLPGTSINFPIAVRKKALGAGNYPLSLVLHYGHGKTLQYATTLVVTAQQVQQTFQPTGPLQAPSGNGNFLNGMPLWQTILVALAVLALLLLGGKRLYDLIFARRVRKNDPLAQNGTLKQTQDTSHKSDKVA